MTLEEAIIHCKEKACDNTQCALEHRQLAEWLKELQSLRSYKNNSIEERARLAAWQIYEEIGLSKHSVDRVSEIIAEKIIEQKAIDIEKACEWLDQNTVKYESGTNMGYIPFSLIEDMINDFKQAMKE